ncbi:hypothetical protein, partial [Escherichia coli]|uniref:hypothetical protein n=1 Tax=Escherichia coli TaxID=562 RepID=UPI001BFC98FD
TLHVLEIRVQFLGVVLSTIGPDISGLGVEPLENRLPIDNGITQLLVYIIHSTRRYQVCQISPDWILTTSRVMLSITDIVKTFLS